MLVRTLVGTDVPMSAASSLVAVWININESVLFQRQTVLEQDLRGRGKMEIANRCDGLGVWRKICEWISS